MNKIVAKNLTFPFLVFLLLGCFGVGFSTWLLGNGNNHVESNVQANIGELNKFDYKDSAYYLMNSESGFEYYIYNNIYEYTKSSLSMKIVLYPSKISSYFTNDIYISFSVCYSYDKAIDFDILSGSNPNIKAPSNFECNIENNPSYSMASSDLIYTKTIDSNNSNNYSYKLSGDILLFSNNKPSLYSLCSRFSNSSNYVVLDVSFNFDIISSIEISNDLNYLNFRFQTSLGGIQLWS